MTENTRRSILLLLAALAIRVAFVLAVPPEPPYADSLEYDTIGWNLASGGGFSMEPGKPTPVRPPGFPAALAAVYSVFGHSLQAAALLNAVLGAFTALALYGLAGRLFGGKYGLLAGWFYAFYPVPVAYSSLLLSETLFTLLFTLSLYCFYRGASEDRRAWALLAGAVLGAATLTRATTILFPAGMVAAGLLLGGLRSWRNSALLLLGFAAALAPWTWRNYSAFGEFMPVSRDKSALPVLATGYEAAGFTYAEGVAEAGRRRAALVASGATVVGGDYGAEMDAGFRRDGLAMIAANPLGYLRLAVKRGFKYWFSSHSSVFGIDQPVSEYRAAGEYWPLAGRLALAALHAAVLLLALAGMFRTRAIWRRWAVLALALAYFNMHIFFDMCPRYLVPIFPCLLAFAAAAFRGGASEA